MTPRITVLRWLPLAALLAWLALDAASGGLRPDLWHLLLLGSAGVAWLAARGYRVTALLAALLLAPVGWHFAVALPAARRSLAEPVGYLRVEGTVRARAERVDPLGPRVHLLLGDARIWSGPTERRLAELEVELPARSAWGFPYRSRLRIGGRLRPGPAGAAMAAGRLRLRFAKAEHYRRTTALSAWSGEALQLHLRDRAAYYLSRPALAVYLPIVLGLRERRTPEAREVAAAFRRVGVAHLFAISGLHVGLLYLLFAALQHWGLGWLLRGQGWVHAPALRRAGVMAAVWAYVALIGFPLPAVRAALMGTLLLWNAHWGLRTPPLYVLGLAALLLLAFDPSQVYDLSFQLSFLAYFFLLCALGLHRPLLARRVDAGWPRWVALGLEGAQLNVWMTAVITLGLWPLVASTFGSLSLLVFAGNLVLIPLLGWFVLPLGLAALGASLLSLGAAPGGWLEGSTYAVLDAALQAWLWIIHGLDSLSGTLVLPVRLSWPPQAVAAYYLAVLGLLGWALRRRRSRGAPTGAAL